jgi:hypothetical protein
LFCSGLDESDITVLAYNYDGYDKLRSEFGRVQWLEENGENFGDCLRRIYAGLPSDHYTLFGCDDVVYIRQFIPKNIYTIMDYDPTILGFVLRVGTTNKYYAGKGVGPYVQWKWFDIYGNGDWGYPFELMASVYKNSLIKEILDTGQLIRNPNDLEAFGSTHVGRVDKCRGTRLCMFNTPSYAVAQDVNRVQSLYENKVAGKEEHAADYLVELEKQGKRLDWTRLFNITPDSPFVGKEYWKVI